MTLPIVHVSVHPDGAIVTRRGTLAPAGGQLRVPGLALLLDPQSVRIEISAAEVLSARLTLDLPTLDPGELTAALEEVEALRDALAIEDARRDAALRERDLFSALAPRFGSDPHQSLPSVARIAEWLETDSLLAARIEGLDDRVAAATERRDELVDEVDAAERRLADLERDGFWGRWVPARALAIETDATGPREVTVSYRVPGARWSPSYLLQADAANQTGRFVLRACVTQVTGEDWSDAHLTVTSLPSARRADVPEPGVWRLGAAVPADATSGWRELPADLDELFPEELAPAAPVAFDLTVRLGPHAYGEATPVPSPQAAQLQREYTLEPAEDVPRTLTPSRARAGASRPTIDGPFSDLSPRPVRTPTPVAAPERMYAASAATGAYAASAATATLLPPPPAPARVGGRGRGVPHDEWLDYARLRLVSFAAGRSRRGRLELAGDDDLILEARAPGLAIDRFLEALRDRHSAVAAVSRRELPDRHVLPSANGLATGAHRGAEVALTAADRVCVPSDGRVHAVVVASWPATVQISYRAVPRNDLRVYRRAKVVVEYDRPLLAGPVEVEVDGRAQHVSPWPGSEGRSELEVPFGPEERVTLTREVRYRDEAEPEADSAGRRRTYTSIEIALASRLPRPVTIDVLERVPVPHGGSELLVEVTEAFPAALPHSGDANGPVLKGGRIQQITLAPGASARAVFGYAVTMSSAAEIVGGSRRG